MRVQNLGILAVCKGTLVWSLKGQCGCRDAARGGFPGPVSADDRTQQERTPVSAKPALMNHILCFVSLF